MQHILGIILYDNDAEIIEDQSPNKGSYLGLHMAVVDAQKRLKQSPNIKQINVYQINQRIKGQERILVQQLFP